MAGKKRRPEEPEDNPDRWLVSYADFITLLFAFFTTMYAISNVDAGKLQKFTGSILSAFKGKNIVNTGVIIEGIKPFKYEEVELENDIRAVLEKSGRMEGVSIVRDERGVLVSFEDALMFDIGASDIKGEVKPVLAELAALIKKVQNNIVIEGHTDNVPIKSSRYSSNWELSTARGTSVLVTFIKEYNINPERFSVSGYGEYRPVASNATPEGRAKNRRVDIIFAGKK